MLSFLCLVIVLGVASCYWREGPLTAFAMLVNVFLAGLVAFNFWEPLADQLDPVLRGSVVQGYEDSVCLVGLFCLTLGLLRLAVNTLANVEPDYDPLVRMAGSTLCGALTGYLVAGFLVCVLQTLPWQRDFLGFDPRTDPDGQGSKSRSLMPPDRVWLALMSRASTVPFSRGPDSTFDPGGSFEARYSRLRRYGDETPP